MKQSSDKLNLKNLNNIDPLKRMVEKQTEQEEFSPMDPPDAYSPPNNEAVPYEEMPPFLQKLMNEHKVCSNELREFEEILTQIQKKGINKEVNNGLAEFFKLLDNKKLHHNTKEEKILFPLLNKRLLEKGEHSKGLFPKTAVDMLEDDHIKILQLAAITFNFFGLAARLPDHTSRIIVLDTAIEQGKALVELINLHIFREDTIVFSLAHKYITQSEFDEMEEQLPKFDHY